MQAGNAEYELNVQYTAYRDGIGAYEFWGRLCNDVGKIDFDIEDVTTYYNEEKYQVVLPSFMLDNLREDIREEVVERHLSIEEGD